ncbi:MAG: hypothetical protein Q7R49_00035 [Candidatus Daviesbacteria bacterium]|nr:hypothetical protein [Candidatus Daviesbacteria bacterium]
MTKYSKTDKPKESKIDKYLKELVIARIEASSNSLKLMVGGNKAMGKQELISSIRKGDELGKEIIKAQIEFLRDMAEGKIYQDG